MISTVAMLLWNLFNVSPTNTWPKHKCEKTLQHFRLVVIFSKKKTPNYPVSKGKIHLGRIIPMNRALDYSTSQTTKEFGCLWRWRGRGLILQPKSLNPDDIRILNELNLSLDFYGSSISKLKATFNTNISWISKRFSTFSLHCVDRSQIFLEVGYWAE